MAINVKLHGVMKYIHSFLDVCYLVWITGRHINSDLEWMMLDEEWITLTLSLTLLRCPRHHKVVTLVISLHKLEETGK